MNIRIAIFLLLLGIIIGVSTLYEKSTNSKRASYVENFNLSFSGVIYDKDSIQQNGGILRVKVLSSTSLLHDVRSETDLYFCTLKGDEAELLVLFIEHFEVNDSIYVDGSKKEVFIYGNNNTVDSFKIQNLMMRGGPLHHQAMRRQEL